MAEHLDHNELVTFEELLISNVFEIAALVELLERKGIITKQEVLDTIQMLRRTTAKAEPPPEPFPEPYLNLTAENAVIDRIFEVMNATGLTAHQAKNLLARVRRLVELGERMAEKTTH